MQRDDGLACPRAAVHEQRAVGVGSDDGVLVGRDRAEDVLHPGVRAWARLASSAESRSGRARGRYPV